MTSHRDLVILSLVAQVSVNHCGCNLTLIKHLNIDYKDLLCYYLKGILFIHPFIQENVRK